MTATASSLRARPRARARAPPRHWPGRTPSSCGWRGRSTPVSRSSGRRSWRAGTPARTAEVTVLTSVPVAALPTERFASVLDAEAYERFDELVSLDEVVILHDPQTAGLVPPLKEAGVPVIWRCHVGIDSPNELAREAWAFLVHYVRNADAFVFSRRAFAWEGLDEDRIALIAPSIDAFSAKNQDLDAGAVAAILEIAGLQHGGAAAPGGRRHPEESRGGLRADRRRGDVEGASRCRQPHRRHPGPGRRRRERRPAERPARPRGVQRRGAAPSGRPGGRQGDGAGGARARPLPFPGRAQPDAVPRPDRAGGAQTPIARRPLNEGREVMRAGARRQPLMRASWPAHSRSRSSNFWILPVEVLGSSSISSTAFGAL